MKKYDVDPKTGYLHERKDTKISLRVKMFMLLIVITALIYYLFRYILKPLNMKSLILIFIYGFTFMGFFFLMSLLGVLFSDSSYHDIISDRTWFMYYSLFFGWWLALFPTREYYMLHSQYFNLIY